MSNLGGYQLLTSAAKKVGGPKNLVLIIASSGAVVYKGSEILVKCGVKAIVNNTKRKKELESNVPIYVVKKDGASNEGLIFKVGEKFEVIESDGDAVLINKIGDTDNPYFVSADLIKKISNYKEMEV